MREKIKKIVKNVLELDIVPDNLSQDNCEKWDSLIMLRLIVEIESEFDISFEPEDIVEMKSLDTIVKKVEEIRH